MFTALSSGQEIIQLSYERLDYFFDASNAVELLQIVMNSIFIYTKLSISELKRPLALAITCLTMVKFLILLRVFDSLGMLVLLIFKCVSDTAPIITY